MKNKIKAFFTKKTIVILTIICVALLSALVYDLIKYNQKTRLEPSHIFVCDNANTYSAFDNWLLDVVGVDKVPTYILIYNQKIIGLIDGNVSENHFSERVGTLLAIGEEKFDLVDYKITNLQNQNLSLKDIANNQNLIILEISWATCDDCIEQDKYFTKDIYLKYGADKFFRYYIKSTRAEVLNKGE